VSHFKQSPDYLVMVATTALALLALFAGSASAANYKTACADKAEGDACEYVSNTSTCCEMVPDGNGDIAKWCQTCEQEGAVTRSTCTIHSRQGYLGCFSQKEDAAVFQVCVGLQKGTECMYETPAGRGKSASNTTGHCIAHYSHQQIMCLEAIGQEDDGECAGKGVGMPCNHSSSPNAVCSHHSRRGSWMCLRPKEEAMVFVVCQGMSEGTACSFTGSGGHGQDAGLIQGECYPHDDHGGMMCMDPEDVAARSSTPATEDSSSNTVIIAVVITAAALLTIMMIVGGYLYVRSRKPPVPSSQSGVVVGQPVQMPNAAEKV